MYLLELSFEPDTAASTFLSGMFRDVSTLSDLNTVTPGEEYFLRELRDPNLQITTPLNFNILNKKVHIMIC